MRTKEHLVAPFLLAEGALFACNRWWEVKCFEGKRKVPDLLM
jgi:hypothetical protein